jgi:hypothetical protein
MVGTFVTSDTSRDRGGLLMLRNLAISTLLFVGASSVANAADVYRWVDEHDGVHYSDQWVPGSVIIKSSRPHSSTASSDAARSASGAPKASSDHTAGQQTTEQNTKAVKQDLAKVREQQCKEAKDRYEKAIQARRIYKPSKGDTSKDTDRPDDRQYMSDDEADAYRVKVRADMQEVCGNSAK